MNREEWKLNTRVVREYIADLTKLLNRFFPGADQPPEDFITALHELGIDLDFSRVAETIASRMVNHLNVSNARTWRAAARKATRSRSLYEALQNELNSPLGKRLRALVNANATLIKSLPLDIARETSHYVARRSQAGIRSSQIANELRSKLPALSKSKIRLIARTETAKSEAALTQARAENLGIKAFEWLSSRDERVRKSHKLMDSVICFYDDLPNPELLARERSTTSGYSPGGIWNCRCSSAPLVSLDEVAWPHRVARQGTIQRMTRAAFVRLTQRPGIAA